MSVEVQWLAPGREARVEIQLEVHLAPKLVDCELPNMILEAISPKNLL